MNTATTYNADKSQAITSAQLQGFLRSVLAMMELNPKSGAQVRYDFDDGAGAVGYLPPWGTVPAPEAKLTTLITAPVMLPHKVCHSVVFTLEEEALQDWVCLLRPHAWGADSSCGEFITMHGKTWTEARNVAMRYLYDNGDFVAYQLVQAGRCLPWEEKHG
jgi:hypothetical protein